MGALERLGVAAEDVRRLEHKYSAGQDQTRQAFAFKWARRDSYDSPAFRENHRRWLIERYCGGDPDRVSRWLAGGRKIVLDAGCGAGFSALLFFGEQLAEHDYLGVDISEAVQVAARRFAEQGLPGDFLQADLLEIPIPEESVDIIFSEGVLHHTDDTGRALAVLAGKLKAGGRFLFYVYRRKAVIREFTDDHVRRALAQMNDQQAWEALKPLTRLGEALGRLGVEIEVPEDIPFLGIRKGRQDLQRFFYWNICKLFYRPEYTLEEMNHVNFDWFRPANSHRHTRPEVEGFCAAAGLVIERLDEQPSGFTVVARKTGAGDLPGNRKGDSPWNPPPR